jgi:transcriptional repressor of cell division inhibition gene dicB
LGINVVKTNDVIKFWGTAANASRALGISPESILQWGEEVPKLRQFQVEVLSAGMLRADIDEINRGVILRRGERAKAGNSKTASRR